MTEADIVFSRFPDFIKEYIYTHNWSELRDIQLDAARVIFESDANLLLSSSTASGKTEAAFFPIITDNFNGIVFAVEFFFMVSGFFFLRSMEKYKEKPFYDLKDMTDEDYQDFKL